MRLQHYVIPRNWFCVVTQIDAQKVQKNENPFHKEITIILLLKTLALEI